MLLGPGVLECYLFFFLKREIKKKWKTSLLPHVVFVMVFIPCRCLWACLLILSTPAFLCWTVLLVQCVDKLQLRISSFVNRSAPPLSREIISSTLITQSCRVEWSFELDVEPFFFPLKRLKVIFPRPFDTHSSQPCIPWYPVLFPSWDLILASLTVAFY